MHSRSFSRWPAIESSFSLSRVNGAIEAFSDRFENANNRNGAFVDFPGRSLTPRECEVLAEIAGGASNKEAGRRLGISPRTVEVHRPRIMDKIGARNAADLVRIVSAAAEADFRRRQNWRRKVCIAISAFDAGISTRH